MMAVGQKNGFKYKPSVEAYLGDPEIRQAVDLLLGKMIPYTPQNPDEWGDVREKFYSACLAAQQTQIEYAQDVHRLWDAIWRTLPKPWKATPPDPTDSVTSLDPADRWEHKRFLRRFELESQNLLVDLWVWLGADGGNLENIEIGFDIWKGEKPMLSRSDMDRPWRWDEDQKLFGYHCQAVKYSDGLDLAELRGAAEKAKLVIKSKVNSRAK